MSMKRLLAAVMALIMTAVFCTSCKKPTDPDPSETAESTNTEEPGSVESTTDEEPTTDTAPTETVQYTADDFAGTYVCERCSATVSVSGGNSMEFRFFWGAGAREYALWTMSGEFDPETRQVSFSDCKKMIGTYISQDEVSESEEYSAGTGRIVFSEDGMSWEDDKEGIANGMLFVLQQEE